MPLGILEPFECNLLRNIGAGRRMSKLNPPRSSKVSVANPDTGSDARSLRDVIRLKSICYDALTSLCEVVSRANATTPDSAVPDPLKCHDEWSVHLCSIQWHQPEALRCRYQMTSGSDRSRREERWQDKAAHCRKAKSNESSHCLHGRRCL